MSRKSDPIYCFSRIVAEYRPQEDIFCEDDFRVALCKKALAELPAPDRHLFILYAEIGNIRKMSRILDISPSTLQYRIAKTRKRLQKQVAKQTTTNKTNRLWKNQ